MEQSQDIHIVLAHYNEDISWTKNILIPYTVISRQGLPKETPPNKGNEASSYLEYIIKNYNNLHDYTIFLHAHRSAWHHTGNIDNTINNLIFEHGYMNINDGKDEDYTLKNSGAEVAFLRVLPIVNSILNTNIDYHDLRFKLAAQFYVKKENILRHPIHIYKSLYEYLMISPYTSNWTGTAYEYLWHYIFTGELHDKHVSFLKL